MCRFIQTEIPMNKFWLLALPLTLLLTACGVEEDEDEVEDIRLMHRNTDDVENGVVDSSKRYDFVLTADDTEYTLRGDLNDIKITGDRNTITLDESLTFDKLVITGSSNVVTESDATVGVGTLIRTGTGNDVTLSTIGTQIDAFTVVTTE